jgi:hypothetical protein
MWAVTAQRERKVPGAIGWQCSEQIPTFYLNSDVQGITDEAGALRLAAEILESATDAVFIHVEAIDTEGGSNETLS